MLSHHGQHRFPNHLINRIIFQAGICCSNARPMTLKEWKILLEEAGFKIKETFDSPMLLLDPKRIVKDEGVARAEKIKANLLKHPELKNRIEGMKKIFQAHKDNLTAYVL